MRAPPVVAAAARLLIRPRSFAPAGLTRRNRFIVAATFACGIGVILRPTWATNNLWPLDGAMKSSSSNGRGKKGVRDAIILILSTGFCFGAVVAFTLNALIPIDKDQPDHTVHLHHYKQEDKAVPEEKLEA